MAETTDRALEIFYFFFVGDQCGVNAVWIQI